MLFKFPIISCEMAGFSQIMQGLSPLGPTTLMKYACLSTTTINNYLVLFIKKLLWSYENEQQEQFKMVIVIFTLKEAAAEWWERECGKRKLDGIQKEKG